MKAFRSSKNLKVIDCKEDNPLRSKIRHLEQQVQMLQKSNLNIFIPLSEHQPKNTPNYEAIIAKLKTQLLTLQQDNHNLKSHTKKLQNQKEMLKINMQNQINKLQQDIEELKLQKKELRDELQDLDEKLLLECHKRKEIQKEMIETRVENKFLKEDITNLKRKMGVIEAKHEELLLNVGAVDFNSKIHQSRKIRVTAIQTEQLRKLKQYIEDLQKQIKQLLSSKLQKVHYGGISKNIGEEIVRLKTNIDLQLGLKVTGQTTASFMQAYNDAQSTFDTMLSACKPK